MFRHIATKGRRGGSWLGLATTEGKGRLTSLNPNGRSSEERRQPRDRAQVDGGSRWREAKQALTLRCRHRNSSRLSSPPGLPIASSLPCRPQLKERLICPALRNLPVRSSKALPAGYGNRERPRRAKRALLLKRRGRRMKGKRNLFSSAASYFAQPVTCTIL